MFIKKIWVYLKRSKFEHILRNRYIKKKKSEAVIPWKLSTKKGKLLYKYFSHNVGNISYIFSNIPINNKYVVNQC